MRRLFAKLAPVLAPTVIAHALAISPSPARPADTRDESVAAKVDQYVKPYVDMRDFSGAILIARDGQVLVRKAYGMANFELGVPNTPETKFRIASLTKTLPPGPFCTCATRAP